MNGPFESSQAQTAILLPVEFQALCLPPQLLPGEHQGHYNALQAAIFRDLQPQSAVEWLLAIDIVELSWEMHRYRVLRQRVLSSYRQKAIEQMLRRIDLVGIAPEFRGGAEIHTIQNALDWQLDPVAAEDIESRLSSYGFDQHAISMETYVEAQQILALFESLLNGAQLRRLLLIKELNNHRRLGPAQSGRPPQRRESSNMLLTPDNRNW
ncbi:hypothetical protein EAS56_37910 [Bradyrhizobium guangzhouense]|uniref:Uncharacterized protein n=1 Tax=Bradyrhizobium guangzhouense TaxID=1325095 RepID=A0ABY0DU56_9BRAD|nr:hypothetical protein [Bradyrhizobium guangzhouense]RXH03658.1 hypothetical protein EAS56_37910 [Bradyrhizobium guangzhouense]